MGHWKWLLDFCEGGLSANAWVTGKVRTFRSVNPLLATRSHRILSYNNHPLSSRFPIPEG